MCVCVCVSQPGHARSHAVAQLIHDALADAAMGEDEEDDDDEVCGHMHTMNTHTHTQIQTNVDIRTHMPHVVELSRS